jgi:proline iminopeptidase
MAPMARDGRALSFDLMRIVDDVGTPPDRLHARIGGEREGQLRAIDHPMGQTTCPGSWPSPGRQALPIGHEGYVRAGGGVCLFYRTVGARGDTVVVLHGGPGLSMSYLAADLEPFAADHVLVFYDQRGAGRSTLVADSIALGADRFVDDLEAVRAHFGLDRLTLLGHSWGAELAARYAARYRERVGRLVLVNPGGFTDALETQAFRSVSARRGPDARRRLEQLEATYLANPGDADACRAYHALFFSAALADTAALGRSRGDFCAGSPDALSNKVESVDRFTIPSLGERDWRSELGAVTAPTLVVHGSMDPVPLESAREWTLALPNGRLLVLDGSGHFSYLETPDRFFAAVRTFLSGKWPAGADVQVRSDDI